MQIIYLHGFRSSPLSKKGQELYQYCANHDHIHVHLPDLNQPPEVVLKYVSNLIESLEQNEVDFSLVSDQLESTQFDFIDILKNELVLVGNTETAAMNPSFDYNTFKHELPLIFRESGSGTRKIMESYLKKQGVSSLKRIELMSNEAVKQAVMAGLGYSIMPLIGIKREIKDGYLAIIPREGLPITTDWKLIWHKEKKPSPVAKAFMNFVLENNERIKQSFFN